MIAKDLPEIIDFRTLITNDHYVVELYNHNFSELVDIVSELGEKRFKQNVLDCIALKKRDLERKLNFILNE